MAKELSPGDMQRLVKLGAKARLEELEAERNAILGVFPDLAPVRRGRKPGRRRGRPRKTVSPGQIPVAAAKAAPRRKRSQMSAAARRATSERMKKYWADRRKAEAKAKAKE